jgi:hypothetical protein
LAAKRKIPLETNPGGDFRCHLISRRESPLPDVFSWHCLESKGLNTPLEQKIHQKFRKKSNKNKEYLENS